MPKHEFTRVRQDVVRRTLRVAAKEELTPRMLRLVFESEDLNGFNSPSADDHIKIFLPAVEGGSPAMRDFTPRSWDVEAGTLTLDFALHPQGPAVDWARTAQPGDRLEIGGPRGSTIAPADFDWYLLIGDATGLPSIGRRLEELPAEAAVHVIALVEGREEEAYLMPAAGRQITWLHSNGGSAEEQRLVQEALQAMERPAGDGFLWVAAEASVARAAYRFAADVWAHPKEWIKAGGYWSAGEADAGERIG